MLKLPRSLPHSRTAPRFRSLQNLSWLLSFRSSTFNSAHSKTTVALNIARPHLAHLHRRILITRTSRTMSSDADYASFLDKANQDTSAADSKSSGGGKSYGTKSVDTAVPKALEQVEEYYVSDADEAFEPVALKFSGGGEISADDLSKLLDGKDVEDVDVKAFEKQYKKVVDAVRGASNGKVNVFKVGLGSTRAEYWVVGVDGKEGRVVGLKALSVES